MPLDSNVLVNVLRGALAPLALDKQRQQGLADEQSVAVQEAQLRALLEEFKQQGRSNIQTQKDTAAAERGSARDTARAGRADKKSEDALAQALRLSRVEARQKARAERREFRRGAPGRELEAREGEALIDQREASAEASRARAAKDRRPRLPKPPKPEAVSTFDGFKREVSNEVTRMMRSFAKAAQPMDELRAEAIVRVVERNGLGGTGVLNLSQMNERQIFNALKSSLSGREAGKTMDQINAEVLGGQ